MTDYSDMTTALISGDIDNLCSLVQAEIDGGGNAGEILNTGLIKGMDIVGEKMQSGDSMPMAGRSSPRSRSLSSNIPRPSLGSTV